MAEGPYLFCGVLRLPQLARNLASDAFVTH
jgi:hypothetical protein